MRHFKNILYVNEAIVEQESGLERAVSLAENNTANLTVVDVIPVATAGIGLAPGGPISFELQAIMESEHLSRLETLVDPFRKRLDIRLDVLVGKTFLEIIRAVLRDNYDLVIKPAEDLVWIKNLFGSNDMHLLRKCPCPVWLLNRMEKSCYNSVMAAIDFDPFNPLTSHLNLNLEILQLSSLLALSDGATLHIVHAWDAFAHSTMMSRAGTSERSLINYAENERRLHEKGMMILNEELIRLIGDDAYRKLTLRHHLPRGPAGKAIARMARELRADVVVMGTIARTGIAGFIIGNTAETILDQLTCSVLAIKPPDFVTPVKLND